MGCCISTTKPTKSRNANVTPSKYNHQPKSDVKSRSPPPPPVLDEETVKEVLSETPVSKPPAPKTQIPFEAAPKTQITFETAAAMDNRPNPTQRPDILQEVKKIEQIDLVKPTEEEITIVSEISEASEMCSFSGGSFSTTTLNDREEGEVIQRVIPRSPAKTPKKRSYSGEMPKDRGLRSQARRSAPSPVKQSQVRSGPTQGRTTVAQRRNEGLINGTRRDPGEGPVQRSRSPAPRGEVLPRRNGGYKPPASSAKGQSGCRLAARKVEEGGKLEKENDGVSADTSESFENPHVSLECFIFL